MVRIILVSTKKDLGQYFWKLLKLIQNFNFKASCLRQVDVYGNKSLDEDGRERFHPINIKRCFEGDYGGWFSSCTINKLKNVIEIVVILFILNLFW